MYYFISNTLFYVLNSQFRWKQLSIADFAIVAKDGPFWCHHSWPGTSRERVSAYLSIVLARANCRKGDLH